MNQVFSMNGITFWIRTLADDRTYVAVYQNERGVTHTVKGTYDDVADVYPRCLVIFNGLYYDGFTDMSQNFYANHVNRIDTNASAVG